MADLSVLVLTYNEAPHIERCIRSVRDWVREIVVVDSSSTDGTPDLARACGAAVVQHPFEHPAQQKNWALRHVDWQTEWVLMLDADEFVPPELRDEMIRVLAEDADEVDGFWLRYRLMFYGRWICHAGWYPVWILRLVRHARARFEDRSVDEHVILDGASGFLTHDLVHESRRDMAFWIEKHNVYSSRNTLEYQRIASGAVRDSVPPRFFGGQTERKRFIKERIWPYMPGRGILFFLYLYVFRLGFLDGRPGFVFCVMHGVFQHFISVKLWELKHFKTGARPGCVEVPKG